MPNIKKYVNRLVKGRISSIGNIVVKIFTGLSKINSTNVVEACNKINLLKPMCINRMPKNKLKNKSPRMKDSTKSKRKNNEKMRPKSVKAFGFSLIYCHLCLL